MAESQFKFDVFLIHSAKDKDTVREVTERLRADRLRYEDWEITLSPRERAREREEKTGAGLEYSRVLVLCLSVNAYGSKRGRLERQAIRLTGKCVVVGAVSNRDWTAVRYSGIASRA